ncbi:FAD-dependent oxidoreductase [Candidatus Acidianus copahuensis]|uniref:FAD-dependent oxidoreductase n=2 Tax=Acidianus TaxID=12914 RepID=A0A031LQQ4_9CREN|nr:NAD(P)/FAD-dependent oxidoreductase [Candidatus Acidianus copahuensis]EZQ10707.1 FAD-dependent oxidoreductase [Candidatus Acidianus copahuensis]NON63291.1 NAD(P)/FAD-dependent oxidoreductase [Acidianus sp. RZ1]
MKYDAIIIGSGHNGLVSSIVLAKHGLKVLVLEKRNLPGGMAETKEYKGVKYSRLSYVLGLFPRRVMDEINVTFPLIDSPVADIFVTENSKIMKIWRDKEKRINEFKAFKQFKYPEFEEKIFRFKKLIEEKFQYLTVPPSFEEVKKEIEGTDLEIFAENTGKVLKEYLDPEFHPYFDYSFMTNLPAYVMTYYFSLDWRLVRGGMGTVGEVLYRRAKSLGVDFLFGETVKEILFDDGVKGVLTDKREIQTGVVINAGSPVNLSALTSGYIKVSHPEFRPAWRRTNVILKELPKMPDFIQKNPGTLYTLPGGEVTIPSMIDELGGHVITIMGGLDEVEDFFPDIRRKAIHIEELRSSVLEEEYSAPFGDMNHMPMYSEFLFDRRPVKGWGYTTPINGLYNASSGTYPGGQVTGVPGRNSAHKVIEDILKR